MPPPDRPPAGREPVASGRDRPARLRTVGLAGSTVMAASAYGAGALPAGDADTAVLPGALPGSTGYWLGLAGWFGGLTMLGYAWWRLGRRITPDDRAGGGPAVPLGWLLGTALLWAAPLLLAPPTASRDVYAYACQGALWLDGVDPYAVGVLPGGCVWSDAVPELWRDTPTPYGPVAVALAGAVVAGARLATTSVDAQLLVAVALLRVVALVGVALVAGFLPRLARACGVDPVRASWLGLLSPLIMIHAVSGAHNDALMLGLVLAALSLAARQRQLAARERHPAARQRHPAARERGQRDRVTGDDLGDGPGPPDGSGTGPGWGPLAAAGVLLGLAVAIKVTAIVAVPFAILLTATRPDPTAGRPVRGRGVAGPAGVLLLAGVLTFAGVTVATGLDLGWIGALSGTGRLVQWTSLPTGLGMTAGYLLRLIGHPDEVDLAVAVARLLGLVALAATVGVLLVRGWWATSLPGRSARRRLVVATGLAFAALALLSPIFYPWYGLTAVTVLAAGLASRRWTRRVAGLVVLASFLVLPNGLGLAVLTKLPGALLDVTLLTALAVVAYRRCRPSWRTGGAGPGGGNRGPDPARRS